MNKIPTEVRLVILVVAVLVVLVWFSLATSRTGREKRHTTDRRVEEVADYLDGQVERGRYKRIDTTAVTDTDSWGHPLRVEYREEGVGERLIVRSAGPDGSFGSDDDITANRFLMNAKGIGEEIKDGTASVAKEAAKGFIRGVKEEVKDTFKRKTATDQNAPSADAPVLKVAVFADGRLTVNGTASTIEGLRESLRTLSEKHGVVWYYREAGQQEPPAVATDVMQAVIDAGLPIRLSSRPDYSDSIGLDGRPITK